MTNEDQELQPERRSIRDIPIPRRRPNAARPTDDVRPVRAPRPVEAEEEAPAYEAPAEDEPLPVRRAPEPVAPAAESNLPPDPPRTYRSDRSRRRGFRWGRVVAILAAIVLAVFLLTWHSATVTVATRHGERQIDLTVPVSIEGAAATGTVPAKTVSATARAEKLLPATGEATVQSKAGGTITIYNEYSAEPQALVRNTRFETPTGLVFRVQEPVTVPGKTAAGPGQVDARVAADQVGESYNIGPIARFTVPGFAGKPQFDGVYAKSEGSMTGGFDGVQKVADPSAVAKAVDELTEQLRGDVTLRAAEAAGQGYQAFAVPASFAVLATGREPQGDQVKVWVEAEADAYAVAESDLADAVAGAVLPGYRAKGEARIDNPADLRVTPKEGKAPSLEVVGSAKVTWTVDANALEAAILGQPIASFDKVAARFGGAESATPVVRPFWRSAFPSDPESIDVIVDGEEDVDE
jgi:hypothetical protein